MTKLNIKEPVTVASLIKAVQSGDVSIDESCVFTNGEVDEISSQLICYLDSYPEMVGDTEVFSDFVSDNRLELLYYGQQFKDVVDSAFAQNPAVDVDVVVSALNYYLDNDDFLDIR